MLLVLLSLLGCPSSTDTADTGKGNADQDNDGTPDDQDCSDGNPAIHPGALDACNGVDDDCDGSTDEDVATSTWYRDQDADSFGDPDQAVEDCRQPAGYVGNADDCEPARPDAYPGAPEHCDGIDHDCDGEMMDQDAIDAYFFFADTDQDGYGNVLDWIMACYDPGGYVGNPLDCDDTRSDVNPAAPEVCDEDDVDEDCDGLVDGLDDWYGGGIAYWPDTDGDFRGDIDAEPSWFCGDVAGFVTDYTDCDDTNPTVSPDRVELCNEVDDDCDGEVDEEAFGATTWYGDGDNDGHGSLATPLTVCAQPDGYVGIADDCDDNNNTIYPGAAESCEIDVDQNCDGYYGTEDHDGDGYVACEECDDGDVAKFPGGTEVCNGEDDDCDGEADEGDAIDPVDWYHDLDDDDWGDAADVVAACDAPEGYVADAGDCDDLDAAFHPGAAETCEDPFDYNCDGALSFVDGDLDGAAECVDCDDADPGAYAGAPEVVADGVDQDCDGADLVGDSLAVAVSAWYGVTPGDGAGAGALLGGVDLDGDSVGDFVAAVPDAYTGHFNNGSAYMLAPAIGTSGTIDAGFGVVIGRGAVGLVGSELAVGDANADGVDDLFSGSALAGSVAAGEAQLLLGPFSGSADVEVAAVFRLVCSTSTDACGASVLLSDQDGDGAAERFVGAPGFGEGVVFGYAGTVDGDVAPEEATIGVIGDTGDTLGGLGAARDLDGDGIDELLVTSTRGTDVYRGPIDTLLTPADAERIWTGAHSALVAAGDADSDGLLDVWLGDGADAWLLGWRALSTSDATIAVVGGGGVLLGDLDLDSDLLPDLVVADPTAASSTGAVRVYLAPGSGSLTAADATITWSGLAVDDAAGTRLGAIPDLDGDARDELLVGSPGDDTNGVDAGAVYLLTGALVP